MAGWQVCGENTCDGDDTSCTIGQVSHLPRVTDTASRCDDYASVSVADVGDADGYAIGNKDARGRLRTAIRVRQGIGNWLSRHRRTRVGRFNQYQIGPIPVVVDRAITKIVPHGCVQVAIAIHVAQVYISSNAIGDPDGGGDSIKCTVTIAEVDYILLSCSRDRPKVACRQIQVAIAIHVTQDQTKGLIVAGAEIVRCGIKCTITVVDVDYILLFFVANGQI